MNWVFWWLGLLLVFSFFGKLDGPSISLGGEPSILILGILSLSIAIFKYKHLSDPKETNEKKRKELGYDSEPKQEQKDTNIYSGLDKQKASIDRRDDNANTQVDEQGPEEKINIVAKLSDQKNKGFTKTRVIIKSFFIFLGYFMLFWFMFTIICSFMLENIYGLKAIYEIKNMGWRIIATIFVIGVPAVGAFIISRKRYYEFRGKPY